jgi:hypothetical protein
MIGIDFFKIGNMLRIFIYFLKYIFGISQRIKCYWVLFKFIFRQMIVLDNDRIMIHDS